MSRALPGRTDHTVLLGNLAPLGARWDGDGTNFAIYSESAESIELCLFDEAGSEERIELPETTAHVHHGYLSGVGPGQRYGYRVHGKWEPGRGLRSNAQKLLIDPYALAVEGDVTWTPAVMAHRHDNPAIQDLTDSAPFVPRSVVVDPSFDWEDDAAPATPWHQTCIYETHVRGLTMTHPGVPEGLRGTYAGMASDAIIEYLVQLGITAVELMPVHHFIPEGFTGDRGLTNYWGYSTAAFFAPHGPYAASGQRGEQVTEFKRLVKRLHQAGLEVLLDVVYNHTTEGSAAGPTFSHRGVDNATYYRLVDEDPSQYLDFTGTGNSLNVRHPAALRMVMDSLRYWVLEMHVDGFRFDLASTLARDFYEVDRLSAFFDLIHQDPVINQTKLIAEPWDVGPGGYQVGNFPPRWSEWNARYRDGVRDFWRSGDHTLADFAYRFSGSSDLYDGDGRRPSASINFVTAHDGYTLADLVSYEHKHNEANREGNRDGHDDNRSWNGGAEGPTSDPDILANRRRRQFALMTTLLLSQGVPMISGGDEIGRTQLGNNNAYCQDNELTWHDWTAVDEELLSFTRRLLRLRADHPVFRRRRFFQGRPVLEGELDDIGWYRPDGIEMQRGDWDVGYARAVAVFLNGRSLGPQGPGLEPTLDNSYLVLFNATADDLVFAMPRQAGPGPWAHVLDSADPTDHHNDVRNKRLESDRQVDVGAWSVCLLEHRKTEWSE